MQKSRNKTAIYTTSTATFFKSQSYYKQGTQTKDTQWPATFIAGSAKQYAKFYSLSSAACTPACITFKYILKYCSSL